MHEDIKIKGVSTYLGWMTIKYTNGKDGHNQIYTVDLPARELLEEIGKLLDK